MKAMIYLLNRLQNLALHQDRDSASNSGEQVRKIIYPLLQICELRPRLNVESMILNIMVFERIFQEVIDAPDL